MLPELLMAQGVIIGHGAGVGIGRGPEVNDRKRAREDGSSGPSKRHTGSTIKEEIPADAREQRIQALQVSMDNQGLLHLVEPDGSECRQN